LVCEVIGGVNSICPLRLVDIKNKTNINRHHRIGFMSIMIKNVKNRV